MRLAVRKSDCVDDWFIIERAEHDGRTWWKPVGFGSMFCKSARLCGIGGFSADIEGDASEMLEIASAIALRGEYSANRCFVDARQEPVLIGSPRNDNGEHGHISLADADELAIQIVAAVRGGAWTSPPTLP